LPPPEPGEYYWVDLEGLRVVTLDGVELGTVASLFATGANDVMVVQGERERLMPFVRVRW
jgi:16S rRNA processing protein RimM